MEGRRHSFFVSIWGVLVLPEQCSPCGHDAQPLVLCGVLVGLHLFCAFAAKQLNTQDAGSELSCLGSLLGCLPCGAPHTVTRGVQGNCRLVEFAALKLPVTHPCVVKPMLHSSPDRLPALLVAVGVQQHLQSFPVLMAAVLELGGVGPCRL